MKSDILAPIKFSHQLWLKESGAHLWLMDAVHGHLSWGLGPRGRHDKASLIKNWTPNCSRCCFCSVLMCVRDYLCWWAVWCVCEVDLCHVVTDLYTCIMLLRWCICYGFWSMLVCSSIGSRSHCVLLMLIQSEPAFCDEIFRFLCSFHDSDEDLCIKFPLNLHRKD